MKIRDIMSGDVRSCSPDDNLALVATMMWDHDCGIVPVVNGAEKPIGVITDRDICIAVATKQRLASDISANEVVTGEIHACGPEDRISSALDLMKDKRIRRLLIIDEDGTLKGLLSLNDIVVHCERGKGKELPGFSDDDVMKALQAICEHRGPRTASSAVA